MSLAQADIGEPSEHLRRDILRGRYLPCAIRAVATWLIQPRKFLRNKYVLGTAIALSLMKGRVDF